MKKIIAITLTIVMLVGIATQIKMIDAKALTYEDLENRNGKLIIEKVIGTVWDDDGNGTALHDDSYYICYSRVNDAAKGSVVCTYFIYNPFTNYADDILFRFDKIMEV